MPTFKYKSRDGTGKLAWGTIDSESVDEVVKRLLSRNLYPSMIRKSLLENRLDFFSQKSFFGSNITVDEKINFTSRLATLLKAGIPLGSALAGVIEQTADGPFRKILLEIKKNLEDGKPLSESMARNENVFSKVHIAMVAAGEYSGSLDKCLARLSSMMEREKEAREKARDAVRYPKIILFFMVAASIVLLGFILPRYEAIFERVNIQLPMPTEILLEFGRLVRRFWFICTGGAAIIYFLFRMWVQTEKGRYTFDRLLYRTPVIGEILLYVSTSGWADALGNLVKSGVPIILSLKMSARASGNSFFSGMVEDVACEVAEGSGLSEPLRRHGLAPPPTSQMIAAGEASGALDDMLFSVREYFEKEAARKIRRLSAYMEPALIFGLSLLVLFLALAVFLPMWDMTRLVQR